MSTSNIEATGNKTLAVEGRVSVFLRERKKETENWSAQASFNVNTDPICSKVFCIFICCFQVQETEIGQSNHL